MGRRIGTTAAPGRDLTELVQSRISKNAKSRIREKLEVTYQTEAAYVRDLIYRDLGLIKKGA
jgi:hypothetical protein